MNTTTKSIAIVCVIGVIAFVGLMGAVVASGSMGGAFTGSGNTSGGMMGSNGHMNGQMGAQNQNGQHMNGMMGSQGHMGMMNGTAPNCQNLQTMHNNMTQNADGTWNCPYDQTNQAKCQA